MIYELRQYHCLPGRMKDLLELMDKLAVPNFRKHGMQLIGAWKPEVGGSSHTLVYMLAYEDMGHRQRAWEAFYQDPDWKAQRPEFDKKFGGPIVKDTESMFLAPTAFSPLK